MRDKYDDVLNIYIWKMTKFDIDEPIYKLTFDKKIKSCHSKT